MPNLKGLQSQNRIICYYGPMGSGKTTQLVRSYQNAKKNGAKCFIFDHPANNRNSERDLISLVPECEVLRKSDPEKFKNADVLYFDEVHMYSAFGNEDLLLDFLRTTSPRIAVFSGLRYDFYNEFSVFPIWYKIHGDCLKVVWSVSHEEKSLVGCYECGRLFEADYSVNLDPAKGRVGDHYANCCIECATEYYKKWQQYQVGAK